MSIAIAVRGLTKTFRTKRGKVDALRGLDLQVREGEVYGFIGVNGAGKSTCIKSILGLIHPTSGTIEVFGEPGGTLEARRKTGYLPEVATYHEFATAEELLLMHARLAGVPSAMQAERCKRALEDVSLSHRSTSRLSEFSKGMKQRFGIAQALVGDPPLLVLDELTSGLDPFAQRELREVIMRLKGKGITVFFSSHYMAEIETICDRVGIVHRGKMRAEGSLHDLLSDEGHIQVELDKPGNDLSLLETWKFQAPRADLWVARVPAAELNACLTELLAADVRIGRVERGNSPLEEYFHQTTLRVDKEEG